MTTLTQTKLNIPAVDVSELSPLPLLENAYPGPRPALKVKAEETDELFTDFGLVRGAVIVMLIFAVIPTVSSALESMNISLLSDLVNASTFGKFFESSNLVANTLQTILP